MLYTLIIVAALYPDYKVGGGVSVHSVPGFSTEQACKNAAYKVALPNGKASNVDPALKVICVAMDV